MLGRRKEGEPLLPWRTGSSSTIPISPSYMTQEEYVQTVASRLLYSRSIGLFYLSLLAASIVEVVWILHPWISPGHERRISYPTSRLFFAVELYLTTGMVCETLLRIVLLRRAFWAEPGNVFDASVCALSVLSFLLYVDRLAQDLEVALLVVMAGWVLLRIARLCTVARTLHRQRSDASRLDVTFGVADGVAMHGLHTGEEEEPELLYGSELRGRGYSPQARSARDLYASGQRIRV
jgi:hypothetical protein